MRERATTHSRRRGRPASARWVVPMLAAAALLIALGGPGWAVPRGDSAPRLPGNVKVVIEEFFVANGTVRSSIAKCPAGTKIFSGGFASTGQHAKVFVAGPSRGENGYVGYAVTPPVNINTGVGKELAKITLAAYCAPVGQPVVLG